MCSYRHLQALSFRILIRTSRNLPRKRIGLWQSLKSPPRPIWITLSSKKTAGCLPSMLRTSIGTSSTNIGLRLRRAPINLYGSVSDNAEESLWGLPFSSTKALPGKRARQRVVCFPPPHALPMSGSLEGVSGCGSGEAQCVSDLKFQKSMSCHKGMLRPC